MTVKKRSVGKPRKFKAPADLVKVIEKYFNSTKQSEWTVTGLSLLVGSKQLLNDYEKRDGFKNIVRTAKLMVENAYELGLRESGGASNIFALKNFGWTDKTEIEQSGEFIITVRGLPIDEELKP